MKASMLVELKKATEYLSIQMDPSMKGNGKAETAVGKENIHTLMVTGMRGDGNKTWRTDKEIIITNKLTQIIEVQYLLSNAFSFSFEIIILSFHF